MPPAADAWEGVLRRTGHAFRELTLAHPHRAADGHPSLATPLALRPLGSLRPLEALLDLFIAAGFGGCGALHAYRLYMGFLYGHVLNELQELCWPRTRATTCCGWVSTGCRCGSSPGSAALAGELATYDGARELDEGLDGHPRQALHRGVEPIEDRP